MINFARGGATAEKLAKKNQRSNGLATVLVLMLPLLGACGGSDNGAKEGTETVVPPAVMIENDASYEEATLLAHKGDSLSEAEVVELEKRLQSHPGDLAARTSLLGRYFSSQFQDDAAREKFVQHALWVIENAPHSGIAGTPNVWIEPSGNPVEYVKAKELWLQHVQNRAEDTRVIWNAMEFFLISDITLASELAEKGRALEPGNPNWREKLGQIYGFQVKYGGASSASAAQRSHDEYEAALAATTDPMKRFYMLTSVANAALEAGRLDSAASHAQQVLAIAEKYAGDWNSGNAIFHGNTILGRVALKKGEIREANRRLLLSTETSGSPQLNSFGPSMALAKELLEQGERESVLQFLEQCRPFWKTKKLDQWIATIRGGGVPDLGGQF